MTAPTVLIVDDSPAFRAAARALLERAGYAVVGEAADGGAALDMTARLRPGLVLLDVNLPDADGAVVCARLVDLPDPPAVVLVSTRDRADLGPAVGASGARGFIHKPDLTADALARLVS